MDTEIAIVGTGVAGIATAYYLCTEYNKSSVLLIDRRQPMSFTSAQSGDNYRNWWPHPVMTRFTEDSIDLLDGLARDTDNVFNMNRRGYALATRRDDIDALVSWLPDDVDIVTGSAAIRNAFPSFAEDITHVIHIKRAGDIDGQQLAQYMLAGIRDKGGRRLKGDVRAIEQGDRYVLDVHTGDTTIQVSAGIVINAAGPFVAEVAAMLGVELPVTNVFQQKLAFEDTIGAIPRDMPFSIDLDERTLNWTDEERDALAEDPELAWLTRPIAGGMHCRPDGGPNGKWVKLGWAYNTVPSRPQQDLANEPRLDPQFAEIVIRGASALNPALAQYIESPPLRRSHYGGYYTMTDENWPLIGPMGPDGSFVIGALSGFGSMAACQAGELCADWVCGGGLPEYAEDLSLARLQKPGLLEDLYKIAKRSIL